ncbi:FAD-dependent oxidoreductase [Cohnella abietis]|uniref:FAD-binding PCMH-type domain-containing protein n=1 Tax=Cohnella abietis TaxID=2507935 RepID=A0A3T1D7C3_9BACL|nr:FAD-dependent oxidoreductase [Cohnella abietis]BBI33955.1 hypothetical protein KCTCHS21_33540 [Cohnella abietis]
MKSKTELTGRVIFKGDPGYDTARKNWDPHTNKFPKVFVFAQKTHDVANAIKWARENNVPIRPRSGRHSLEVNLSQVNGGIVIDVSDLKTLKLDKKNKTVIVGTGNRVGRIAKTLARQGFIGGFGDSPSVGIGGITLGGGIGPLQRTIGLISDNLLELKMVDAKGRVIRANKKCNSDLYWASRGGGGGNFGVYTQYKFKTIRAPTHATVYRITWPWDRKLQPYIVGSYINVPDQGIKNSGPVYYGANFPRLRRVKAKYDPENVFNNPQSIPPTRRA